MSTETIEKPSSLAVWIAKETDETALLDRLQTCLSLTVENIMSAALIVRRFEELGLNKDRLATAVPGSMLRVLRRIAHGQMLPETFMRLDGTVQDRVGSLPITDQKRLIDGSPVKVMIPGGDHLMIAVENLQPDQCRQVFGRGHIRDEAEQISYLAERGQMTSAPKETPVEASVDRRRRVLVVPGPTEFTERQLIAFIAELAK